MLLTVQALSLLAFYMVSTNAEDCIPPTTFPPVTITANLPSGTAAQLWKGHTVESSWGPMVDGISTTITDAGRPFAVWMGPTFGEEGNKLMTGPEASKAPMSSEL
jgi:hypothetical protein